jgi:DNA-3-methyladenine glycosylase II
VASTRKTPASKPKTKAEPKAKLKTKVKSKPRAPRKPKAPPDPWAEAIAHLRAIDEKWAARIDKVGPCRIEIRPDRFGTLVRAIIGQQISTKAARSIDQRLRDLAGDIHEPESLRKVGLDALRSVGLSGVKAQYILNLAEAVLSGSVPIHEFHEWEDEAIVASLTSIKGIGPWTAEMFLVFCLGRLDVISPGDLGIRVGIKNHHGLDAMPTPKQCRELTESCRPYRSIAMWYLWREIDPPK